MGLCSRVKALYVLEDCRLRPRNVLKAVVLPGYPTTTAVQLNHLHKKQMPESYPGGEFYLKAGLLAQAVVMIPHAMLALEVYHAIMRYI